MENEKWDMKSDKDTGVIHPVKGGVTGFALGEFLRQTPVWDRTWGLNVHAGRQEGETHTERSRREKQTGAAKSGGRLEAQGSSAGVPMKTLPQSNK